MVGFLAGELVLRRGVRMSRSSSQRAVRRGVFRPRRLSAGGGVLADEVLLPGLLTGCKLQRELPLAEELFAAEFSAEGARCRGAARMGSSRSITVCRGPCCIGGEGLAAECWRSGDHVAWGRSAPADEMLAGGLSCRECFQQWWGAAA